MVSNYLYCSVGDTVVAQTLEQYERDLDLRPVWIDVQVALVAQRIAAARPGAHRWARREALALQVLALEALNPPVDPVGGSSA